jgi:hypothetical protein
MVEIVVNNTNKNNKIRNSFFFVFNNFNLAFNFLTKTTFNKVMMVVK